MNYIENAKKLRPIIEQACAFLDDKTASIAPTLFPHLKFDGTLIRANTRINWNNAIKKAATDLWGTQENSPDSAPSLWIDIEYKEGYRIIPDTITVTSAFAKDEYGWWNGVLYKSLVDSNVYTPAVYPAGWEEVK